MWLFIFWLYKYACKSIFAIMGTKLKTHTHNSALSSAEVYFQSLFRLSSKWETEFYSS